jgi:hypothetical protein
MSSGRLILAASGLSELPGYLFSNGGCSARGLIVVFIPLSIFGEAQDLVISLTVFVFVLLIISNDKTGRPRGSYICFSEQINDEAHVLERVLSRDFGKIGL